MYTRAVVPTIDSESCQRTGVLIAGHDLLKKNWLDERNEDCLRELLGWFNQNIPIPRRRRWKSRSIFWFKGYDGEWVDYFERLCQFLCRWYDRVEVLETRKPGYLIYEDDYQVAAIPFRDTFDPNRARY